MLISETQNEPTNEELGIQPYPKSVTWPLAALIGLAIWAVFLVLVS